MHKLLFLFLPFAILLPLLPVSAVTSVQAPSAAAGRIVLDVEANGEAWYVSPLDNRRHFLGRPDDALVVMRRLALGISKANLALIPTGEEIRAGDLALRSRLAGRILLSVEDQGEAWYVYPANQRRYRLGRPEESFGVMRSLGLGISSEDLSHLPQAVSLEKQPVGPVPFVAQAPFGEWNDVRQQEGCEEASVLMAVAWARGFSVSAVDAKQSIIDMSEFQRSTYGYFIDTSAQDTLQRLLNQYYGHTQAILQLQVDAHDVISALAQGNLALLPVNGQKLGNPNFSGSGPLRHMIVVYGYDEIHGEFMTHEPGTRQGSDWRYSFNTIEMAMNDYASGEYEPLPHPPRTAMITVSR